MRSTVDPNGNIIESNYRELTETSNSVRVELLSANDGIYYWYSFDCTNSSFLILIGSRSITFESRTTENGSQSINEIDVNIGNRKI